MINFVIEDELIQPIMSEENQSNAQPIIHIDVQLVIQQINKSYLKSINEALEQPNGQPIVQQIVQSNFMITIIFISLLVIGDFNSDGDGD